jgi:glutathione S-transferase
MIDARCYGNKLFLPQGTPNKMTNTTPLMLKGSPGSPYTRKMLALLRYRRIPYRFFVLRTEEELEHDLPLPKVELLPTFYFSDASGALSAVVDSTHILRRLEDDSPGRSVIPTDPVIAFIDYLLEDFADEWLTKAMFHYRWAYAANIEKAAQLLARFSSFADEDEPLVAFGKEIADRQISRLNVVGSNETTAPIIEESYKDFLDALALHLTGRRYMLGDRPSACDFAVFGQLTQLVGFDPTTMAIALERTPRIVAWVDLVEDLTGVEPKEDAWFQRDAIPDTMRGILAIVGRTYVPVMLANAAAVASSADEVRVEVTGKTWVQNPFPYQAKCVAWIREQYRALEEEDRKAVDQILDGTGCERLLA